MVGLLALLAALALEPPLKLAVLQEQEQAQVRAAQQGPGRAPAKQQLEAQLPTGLLALA